MEPWITLPRAFLLLGVLAGGVFVLDGWQRSSRQTELKSSLRMRGLFWVIGIGVGTLLLDLHKLGIQLPLDSTSLWIDYILGVFLGITCILSVCIFLLYLSIRPLQKKMQLADGAFWHLLSFYLHRGHQAVLDEKKLLMVQVKNVCRQKDHEFLKRFADELAQAVAIVNHHMRRKNGEVEGVAQELLRLIARIAEECLHVDRINVNYMHAYQKECCSEEIKTRARFQVSDKERYSHYLSLRYYARDAGSEGFSLPVEAPGHKSDQRLLPGAPYAYRHKQPVYVGDTAMIPYPRGLESEIISAQKEYFQDKKFKCFLSVPIIMEGEPIGVLNMDADQKFAFGQSDDEKEQVVTLVLPFCGLLSAIVVRGDCHGSSHA